MAIVKVSIKSSSEGELIVDYDASKLKVLPMLPPNNFGSPDQYKNVYYFNPITFKLSLDDPERSKTIQAFLKSANTDPKVSFEIDIPIEDYPTYIPVAKILSFSITKKGENRGNNEPKKFIDLTFGYVKCSILKEVMFNCYFLLGQANNNGIY